VSECSYFSGVYSWVPGRETCHGSKWLENVSFYHLLD
jgi:hypothetical protein